MVSRSTFRWMEKHQLEMSLELGRTGPVRTGPGLMVLGRAELGARQEGPVAVLRNRRRISRGKRCGTRVGRKSRSQHRRCHRSRACPESALSLPKRSSAIAANSPSPASKICCSSKASDRRPSKPQRPCHRRLTRTAHHRTRGRESDGPRSIVGQSRAALRRKCGSAVVWVRERAALWPGSMRLLCCAAGLGQVHSCHRSRGRCSAFPYSDSSGSWS